MGTNEELHQEPTADLLRRLTDQTSTLIQQEMALARAEMQAEAAPARDTRRGSGLTALFGLGATGAFVAASILALATVVEAWIAALGVAAALALAAWLSAATRRAGDDESLPAAAESDYDPDGAGIEVYASGESAGG